MSISVGIWTLNSGFRLFWVRLTKESIMCLVIKQLKLCINRLGRVPTHLHVFVLFSYLWSYFSHHPLTSCSISVSVSFYFTEYPSLPMPAFASLFPSNCRASLSDSFSFIVMEKTFHFIFSCEEEDKLNTKCQVWTMLYKPFGCDSQSVSQHQQVSETALASNTWQIKVAKGTSCNNPF